MRGLRLQGGEVTWRITHLEGAGPRFEPTTLATLLWSGGSALAAVPTFRAWEWGRNTIPDTLMLQPHAAGQG